MAALERPRTINQILRDKEGAGGPEQIETLTEEELLGIDKPIYEILSHGQSLLVPKVVKILTEQRDLSTYNALLNRFSLNTDLFHPETNPHGLLSAARAQERGLNTALLTACLQLVGVRTRLIQDLFSSSNDMLSKRFSPAFAEARNHANHQRHTFAFRNLEQFPAIQKLLRYIEACSGLKAQELFQNNSIPALHEWRAFGTTESRLHSGKKPLLLEEALITLALALSGENTIAEISARVGRGAADVGAFLGVYGSSRKILSQTVQAAVRQRIKRAR